MHRGDVWWATLPDAAGSGPAFRRPVLIVQADSWTRSRIATVIVAVITSNLRLATAPGNVLLRARESGLPKDAVINVSQIITLDKTDLDEQVGQVAATTLADVDQGLRLVFDLSAAVTHGNQPEPSPLPNVAQHAQAADGRESGRFYRIVAL